MLCKGLQVKSCIAVRVQCLLQQSLFENSSTGGKLPPHPLKVTAARDTC